MVLKYIWSVTLSLFLYSSHAFAKDCEIRIYAKFSGPIGDPITAVTWWDKKYVSLTYSTLLRYDENGNLTPGIAKIWRVDAKKKTLKIILNPNITAHDGTLITSDDVMFVINRIRNERNPDRNKFKNILEVSKINTHELEIHYKEISAYDIYLLATPRLSIYKKDNPQIGSGPWVLKRSNSNTFNFERFSKKNSIKSCSHLAAYNYPLQKALEDFKKGHIDLIEYLSLGQDELLKINKEIKGRGAAHPINIFDTTILFYSKQKSDLTENRNALLSLLYNNKMLTHKSNDKLAGNVVSSGLNKLYSEEISISPNLKYKMSPEIIWVPDSVEYKGALINNLQSIFKASKMPISIKKVSLAELYRLHSEKIVNFHLETITLQSPHPYGVLSLFSSESEENFTGFRNAKFDELLKKGLAATELEGHQHFAEASRLLVQSGYAIPLVNQIKYVLVRDNIKNYNFSKISTYHEYYSTLEKN